jgi:hypothetical protein
MRKFLLLIAGLVIAVTACRTPQKAVKDSVGNPNFLTTLMQTQPEKFGKMLANPSKYELQIIYTQIDRDAQNVPHFRTFTYRADSLEYFYPASTVKMALSFMALEKVNQLQKTYPDLKRNTPYSMDSTRALQQAWRKDTSASNGLPSLEQDIKQVFLVSDNFAYNHLFDFLGRDYINATFEQKGYAHSRVMHRFSIPGIDNRYTSSFKFFEQKKLIYGQPESVATRSYTNLQHNLLKGIGHWDSNDKLVSKPFDFSTKNYFTLDNQQLMLRAVLFPESVNPKHRFDLTADDYQFVYRYLSMFPHESRYPNFNADTYDGFCKFFMYGDGKQRRPDHIRIFNKVGDAYGYMIDNAYIVDFERNVEFMLSAVILSNEDGIFNDGKYEYETVGTPFLSNLGTLIYDYECKRAKKYKPNLDKFKLEY